MKYFLLFLAFLVLTCDKDYVVNPKKCKGGKDIQPETLLLPCGGCRRDWVTITLQDCYADLKDCGTADTVRYFKKSIFTIGSTYGYELLNDQIFKDQNGNLVYLEAGTKFCYKTPFGGCFIPDCACYPFFPCLPGGCPD